MKSLQVIGDSSYGGGGYLLLKWCEYLLRQGCDVDVVATDPFVLAELKKIKGVRAVKRIYIPREIKPLRDAYAFVQLLSLIQRGGYDVVHTYTATPSFLGRVAARLIGTPVIVHHQAGWTITEYSSSIERIIYTPLEYIAALASTKSICVSHAIAQEARQLRTVPSGKLITICNGIETEPFISASRNGAGKTLRRELGISVETVLIGNTGRLATQKDNETLISSMLSLASLVKDIPFCLLLAGDGPEQERLEALVRSEGLSNYVRFLGFYKDVPKFLAGLDVFVSPSYREGLSISLLEAMAAAKPIVTTSILPNAELIEHEVTGLLVAPRSPEQVAQAIARFIRDPDLAQRCAVAARERVLRRYTIDRMFQETWDLYVNLLQQKGWREAVV